MKPDHAGQSVACLVRLAQLAELVQINALVLRSKASWGYSAQQMALWNTDLHIDAATVERGAVYVAELDGVLVGMFVVEPSPEAPELIWQLAHFFVCPEHFGKKIGTRLFAFAIELARCHDVHSILIDSDPNAERFYWSQGARRSGVLAAPTDADPNRVRPQLVLSLIEFG